MKADATWARIPWVTSLMRRLSGGPGDPPAAGAARPFLTPHQFQEELEILGLSGIRFDPEDYRHALSEYLGICVSVHVIPDERRPEISRHLALSGRLGEVRYSDELGIAAIFLPGSLPPLLADLTLLHELGHVAAGDLMADSDSDRGPVSGGLRGRRLARAVPFEAEDLREHEANLRASYALSAGCLGAENPYVHDLYNVP